ncbi:MAG TPA: 6-phosphogluconolactonase [Candidatus Saccharimonadales bacterium]|jgi:6-phosphogluconolactonase/glucosamine-6-phosphate isomerase/deaminase
MQFVKGSKTAAAHAVAKAICDGLFDGKQVLWLVSGGSNIVVEKGIMDMLHNHVADHLTGLAVMPMDERYGPLGHKDSNVQQLREAGFDPGTGALVDVLLHDTPFDQTVSFYNDVAAAALASADVIVGQFGMGGDGHVAGIKPNSPATEADEATVAGYDWEDYQRLTLMPAALRQTTAGFLVAYGDDKRGPLEHLQKKDEPFAKLPAVLLYELPDVYVYNDQMESEG